MALVTVPANGNAIEVVAAASTKAVIQNAGSVSIVVENAADPLNGIILKGGDILQLDTAWTAAWTAKSPHLQAVPVRVAQE